MEEIVCCSCGDLCDPSVRHKSKNGLTHHRTGFYL